MSAHAKLQGIVDALSAAFVEADKFDKGNSAAGTRVRGAAQTAKTALQELRLEVQAAKTAKNG